MRSKIIILATLTVTLFSGCTVKTKGFIEDLYSNTKTINSVKQTSTINQSQEVYQQQTQQQNSVEQTQTYTIPEVYTATGKVLSVTYDQDINLYVYNFLKDNDSQPIVFYYDKDLKLQNTKVTVSVKENFLKSISKEIQTKRTLKKRIKSNIKTPIIEKINTL